MQGLTLKEVNLNPAKSFILFSLINIQKAGWKVHGYNKTIWLTKGYSKLVFDKVINTPKGGFLCAYFKINIDKVSAALYETKPNISIQLAHGILGHMKE